METEIELKLLIEPEDISSFRRLSILKEWAQGAKPVTRTYLSIYYDTADLALLKAGMALRVRRVGRGWSQTIKGGGQVQGGLHQRQEWEYPVASPEPDLGVIKDTAFAAELNRIIGKEKLLPVFATEFRRTIWNLAFSGGGLVEMALDQGEVRSGQHSEPISEVELELKGGASNSLYDIALALLEKVPLVPGSVSKAERGYKLYLQEEPAPVKASATGMTPGMTAGQMLQCILGNCIEHLQRNRRGMLLGKDPEYLHQMRVAVRRIRSALSLFDEIIPRESMNEIGGELKWLGTELGKGRDWDVFATETLRLAREHFSGQQKLPTASRRTSKLRNQYDLEARQAVASKRYAHLVLILGRWINEMAWLKTCKAEQQRKLAFPGKDLAFDLLKRAEQKLHRRGKHIDSLGMKKLHLVRIAAKKLRYAVEFFMELYPPKKARRYLAALTEMQDILGTLNDSAIAYRLLEELCGARPSPACTGETKILGKWIDGKREEKMTGLPKAWKNLVQQKPFWK